MLRCGTSLLFVACFKTKAPRATALRPTCKALACTVASWSAKYSSTKTSVRHVPQLALQKPWSACQPSASGPFLSRNGTPNHCTFNGSANALCSLLARSWDLGKPQHSPAEAEKRCERQTKLHRELSQPSARRAGDVQQPASHS